MTELVTRCPECNIAFRALPAHLSAAKGLVRCGTCLTVFKARDYLVEGINLDTEEPSSPLPTPPSLEELAQIDDTLLDLESGDLLNNLVNDSLAGKQPEEIAELLGTAEAERIDVSPDRTETLQLDILKGDIEPPKLSAFIHEELLEQHQKPPTKKAFSTSRFAIFLSVTLLGVFVLAAGLAYMNSPALSLNENYRNYLLQFCAISGCKISDYRDLEKIKTEQFVVRSHPEKPETVKVDFLLENHALFEQRFPKIIISFSDIDGKLITKQRYLPKEYLSGSLRGAIFMPRLQKIHVSLEIIDPGVSAVNYSLNLAD